MSFNKKLFLSLYVVFQTTCFFAFGSNDFPTYSDHYVVDSVEDPDVLELPAGLPYPETLVKYATRYAKSQNDALQKIKDSGAPLPQSLTALALLNPSLPIDSRFFVGSEDKGGFVQPKLKSEMQFDSLQQEKSDWWCFCRCRKK